MGLKLKCLGCKKSPSKSTAILFSPVKGKGHACYKYNLCRGCFNKVVNLFGRAKNLSKD
jgi:hypothetical protein